MRGFSFHPHTVKEPCKQVLTIRNPSTSLPISSPKPTASVISIKHGQMLSILVLEVMSVEQNGTTSVKNGTGQYYPVQEPTNSNRKGESHKARVSRLP